MRILFISGCAPAKFNHREPNAYPYYIIKELSTRHETAVLYFNNNKKINLKDIHDGLNATGVVLQKEIKGSAVRRIIYSALYIPRAIIMKVLLRMGIQRLPSGIVPFHLQVYKKFPSVSFDRVSREFAPDLVIAFPLQLYYSVKKLTHRSIPVTLLCTDSIVLHFRRQLNVADRIGTSLPVLQQMIAQSTRLEDAYRPIHAKYLFVGKEDKESFVANSGKSDHSFIIPHHLYSDTPGKRNWNTTDGRINIFFGGDGYTIYVGDETDRIAEQIAASSQLDPQKANFYFLGSRYDKPIETLRKAGYTVFSQEWAEDYDAYMANVHVQIFPTIMGTGTKAKVLAAMVSGLLCVGTWYAFENIYAAPPDYLLYENPADIPGILTEICNNRSYYEQVAVKTQQKILIEHDTARVVDRILEISV